VDGAICGALQKCWDRQRAGLDLILDQRDADMADLPGGASGLLVRHYKPRNPNRLVAASNPRSRSASRQPKGRAPAGRRW
jgi:hypothetical protein